MKISFDLDGTLLGTTKEFNQIFELVKILSKVKDLEIVILTSRDKETWKNNTELKYFLVNNFDILIKDVLFSGALYKYLFIDSNNIDIHFDDNPIEVELINKNCKGKAVLVCYGEG